MKNYIIKIKIGNKYFHVSDEKKIFLSDKNISEIEIINDSENLQYLFLDNNNIKNIKGIEKLQSAMWISLNRNPIKNLDGVENLNNLKRVDLNLCGIEKNSTLFSKLEKLNLEIFNHDNNTSLLSD